MLDLEALRESNRRSDRRTEHLRLLALDMKCFYLEQRVIRLERQRPCETRAEKLQWRLARMKIRADLEILKIDFAAIERRAAEFLR